MRSIQEFSSDLRQSARTERDCSSSKHSERNASRGYACPEGRSFRGFPRTKLFVFSPSRCSSSQAPDFFSALAILVGSFCHAAPRVSS